MDKKKVELYDPDIVVDDGHDTPKELAIKERMSLDEWEKRVNQVRDERMQETTDERRKQIEINKRKEDFDREER